MRVARPFAPVSKDAVCLQVYGGPRVAFVKRTNRGSRIWAWSLRRDSCETARWKRVSFLFVAKATLGAPTSGRAVHPRVRLNRPVDPMKEPATARAVAFRPG